MMRFRLKELLEFPGAPSQAELARRLDVPRQQINRLVNGNIERIDLKTLDKLYQALDCRSVEDLIEYVPEPVEQKAVQSAGSSSMREWMVEQLIGMLLAHVHRDPDQIYTDPAVRQAAEDFFDQHLAQDLQGRGVLSGLHGRLMQEMLDYLKTHGARFPQEEENEIELDNRPTKGKQSEAARRFNR